MDKEDSKKERILDAAMQCFSRFGMNKATMDDIAHVLGMKKASLYYYYKNKEAIFVDAIKREIEMARLKIQENLDTAKTSSDKLTVYIEEMVDHFGAKEFFELNLAAVLENNALMQNIQSQINCSSIDFLTKTISEGIANGEFRQGDAKALAETLHSVFEARKIVFMQNALAQSEQTVDFQIFKDELLRILELILNGLKTRK